jgi:hypothetical protein
MESGATTATAMTATPTLKAPSAAAASVTDCCICESARLDSGELRLMDFVAGLFPVTVCQALFIAPCSHVTVSTNRCYSGAHLTTVWTTALQMHPTTREPELPRILLSPLSHLRRP